MASESTSIVKVCGLCSQFVDTAVDLNESILEFLSKFLFIAPDLFPPKICTDCFSSALDAKRFKETCLRAIHKIQRSSLSASLILGSRRVELSSSKLGSSLQVHIPFTERVEADKKFESEGCSYSKSPLSQSKSISSNSRKRSSLSSSKSSPKKRHRKDDKDEDESPGVSASSRRRREDPEEEDLDSPEVFPSVGPYQCEICYNITNTKHEFVSHIKEHHRTVVDEDVLESLEMDLKKVERRLRKAQRRLGASSRTTKRSKSQAVTCPKCSMRISNKHNLKKHLRSKICKDTMRRSHKSSNESTEIPSDVSKKEEEPKNPLEDVEKKMDVSLVGDRLKNGVTIEKDSQDSADKKNETNTIKAPHLDHEQKENNEKHLENGKDTEKNGSTNGDHTIIEANTSGRESEEVKS